MSIYDNPIYSNGRVNKEFFNGKLLKAGNGVITEIPFKFSKINTRDYTIQNSVMPGREYIKPTETIGVSNINLKFAKGDKVRLDDNRIMTVQTAKFDENVNRAVMGGQTKTRWIVVLEGGGK